MPGESVDFIEFMCPACKKYITSVKSVDKYICCQCGHIGEIPQRPGQGS